MTLQLLNKMISIVLSAVITMFHFSFSFGNNEIYNYPAVFEYGGDSYCVMWETAKKGTGYVKYTYEGEEKIIWDEELGVIRTDDVIHRVFVPKDELRGNDYIVGSRYVYFKYSKAAIKGRTVESEVCHFRGDEKEDDLNIMFLPDIHGYNDRARTAAEKTGVDPDLLIIPGDVESRMENKKDFSDTLLSNAAVITKGTIPVVYIRGNHESRGEFAAQLMKYLPTYKSEPYFTFEFGPLSAVMLDTGEDKDDSHEDYNGLINFKDFREKEFEWIKSLKAEDFTGEYKIVFAHIPGLQDFWGENWTQPFVDLGFELCIGGHLHTCKSWNRSIFPLVVAGGVRDDPEDYWACNINLRDGAISLRVSDMSGNTVYTFVRAQDGTMTQEFFF